MDPVQLTLTATLLWLTKTAATAGEGGQFSVDEPEKVGDQEEVQDPLGLKESVFIVTPIVMVRKQDYNWPHFEF